VSFLTALAQVIDRRENRVGNAAQAYRHAPPSDDGLCGCALLAATVTGPGNSVDGAESPGPLALALLGFAFLTLGGWLGGTIVFVYGMPVLSRPEEPALRAASPSREEPSGEDSRAA
jgi:hypothetical protein